MDYDELDEIDAMRHEYETKWGVEALAELDSKAADDLEAWYTRLKRAEKEAET